MIRNFVGDATFTLPVAQGFRTPILQPHCRQAFRLPQGSKSYRTHDVSHVYTHLKVAIIQLPWSTWPQAATLALLCWGQKDRISSYTCTLQRVTGLDCSPQNWGMFESFRTCGACTLNLRRAPRGGSSSAERRHPQLTHSRI